MSATRNWISKIFWMFFLKTDKMDESSSARNYKPPNKSGLYGHRQVSILGTSLNGVVKHSQLIDQ